MLWALLLFAAPERVVIEGDVGPELAERIRGQTVDLDVNVEVSGRPDGALVIDVREAPGRFILTVTTSTGALERRAELPRPTSRLGASAALEAVAVWIRNAIKTRPPPPLPPPPPPERPRPPKPIPKVRTATPALTIWFQAGLGARWDGETPVAGRLEVGVGLQRERLGLSLRASADRPARLTDRLTEVELLGFAATLVPSLRLVSEPVGFIDAQVGLGVELHHRRVGALVPGLIVAPGLFDPGLVVTGGLEGGLRVGEALWLVLSLGLEARPEAPRWAYGAEVTREFAIFGPEVGLTLRSAL